MKVAVILSPFASLRVNCAKHLQYRLENKQMRMLRFAQPDSATFREEDGKHDST